MTRRIDEIESNLIYDPADDISWLATRVRKLEKALGGMLSWTPGITECVDCDGVFTRICGSMTEFEHESDCGLLRDIELTRAVLQEDSG